MTLLDFMQTLETHSVRFFALLHRLWKCLHPFTWAVMLMVGVAMVIIVVPGERQLFWDMEIENETDWAYSEIMPDEVIHGFRVDMFMHGWPRSAVARAVHVPYPPSFPPPPPPPPPEVPYWTHVKSWPFAADRWIVNWLNLVIDVVAVAVVLVGISAAVEIWLRRRGRLWRFRIVDLLILLTVGAVVASWYQVHRHLRLAEEEVSAYIAVGNSGLSPLDRNGIEQRRPKYCGPRWLQRLVGHDNYLPDLCHAHRVELEITESWRQDLEQLVRLAYVEEVEIVGVIPKVVIERLGRLPRLKALELVAYRNLQYSDAGDYWRSIPKGDCVQPWELDRLRELPLSELTIESHDVLAEDVERMARSIPRLETLYLQHVPVNSSEMNSLRAEYPFITYYEDFNDSAEGVARHRDEVKQQRAERLQPQSSAR